MNFFFYLLSYCYLVCLIILLKYGSGLHFACLFCFLGLFFLPPYRPGRKRDFSPLPWSQYFETMEDVEVENENGKDISLTAARRKSTMNY